MKKVSRLYGWLFTGSVSQPAAATPPFLFYNFQYMQLVHWILIVEKENVIFGKSKKVIQSTFLHCNNRFYFSIRLCHIFFWGVSTFLKMKFFFFWGFWLTSMRNHPKRKRVKVKKKYHFQQSRDTPKTRFLCFELLLFNSCKGRI